MIDSIKSPTSGETIKPYHLIDQQQSVFLIFILVTQIGNYKLMNILTVKEIH
jgi:hypothetical protein